MLLKVNQPKEEDLPNEIITKEIQLRLSLKPLNDELFDDDVVVSNFTEGR